MKSGVHLMKSSKLWMRRKKVHELSIAMGMIDEITRIARENNARKVITVKLKIGKMSGIVIDSLRLAFDATKLEYPLVNSTKILIDEVPLMYECNVCKKTFNPEDKIPPCPPLPKG